MKNAYIDEFTLITIPLSEVEVELSDFKIINVGSGEVLSFKKWEKKPERWRYELYLPQPIQLDNEYKIIANNHITYNVKTGRVVRTRAFDEQFSYDGELGVIYTKTASTFNLWAPTATKVQLILFDKNEERIVTLKRNSSGVWQGMVEGDLDEWIYLYRVFVNGSWRDAVDPYAKAVTVNGEKGVILNLSDTHPKKWFDVKRPVFKRMTDAIIYELNIRDFSIDRNSGIIAKGKYKGLIESGTKGPLDTITGLDYLIDLGVTHVQLLPIQDFGTVDETKPLEAYNWGYDTIHYQAIEGSYSLNPFNPKQRIKELKEVVRTFHENGLRVIIDVVFNHVYIHQQSSFEKIVPGYFFRYNLDGSLANGTGVGNDIASERQMVRKFIVDSVLYLANEFQVDGFRFDLMGIIDIETMQRIRVKLSELDPSTLVIGEGWDLPTALTREKKATIENSDQLPGISQFNDQFRDKLKGNVFNHALKGFCNGNSELKDDVKMLVSGSTKDFYLTKGIFSDPYKSVNYVECHDNHTLWDKLEITNGTQSTAVRQAMHRLATAMTILSQGIPFLHAGQEFFRTKSGVENSYCSSDEINKLDWKRKAHYSDNIEYVKALIALRKQHDVFRFLTKDEIKKHMHILDTPAQSLAYMLKNRQGIFVVVHNSSNEVKEIILPASGKWEVFVENNYAAEKSLRTFQGAKVTVGPISTTVLFYLKT